MVNNLTEQLAKVVLVGDVCYEVREPDPGEIDCYAPQCVHILAEHEDCDRCLGCSLLTDCEAAMPYITTYTDLGE